MNIEQTNKFFIDASFNHLIEVKNNGDALLTIHNDGTITAAEHLKPTETAAEVLRIMRETWMADAQSIKIRELRERIKRLEEVGDEVVINYVNSLSAFEMWRKCQGGQAVSVEERILFLAESPDCNHPRELRAIAFQVRKLEDRIKQLESENDALRADLLLWEEKEAKP